MCLGNLIWLQFKIKSYRNRILIVLYSCILFLIFCFCLLIKLVLDMMKYRFKFFALARDQTSRVHGVLALPMPFLPLHSCWFSTMVIVTFFLFYSFIYKTASVVTILRESLQNLKRLLW